MLHNKSYLLELESDFGSLVGVGVPQNIKSTHLRLEHKCLLQRALKVADGQAMRPSGSAICCYRLTVQFTYKLTKIRFWTLNSANRVADYFNELLFHFVYDFWHQLTSVSADR